jgi:hypothetical protein
MQHFFQLVIAGVCPVRTTEAEGGSTTMPTDIYLGIKRFNCITKTAAPQIVISNIDNDISTDDYSCFFPSPMMPDVGSNGIEFHNEDVYDLAEVRDIAYANYMPRLICSNDETVVMFHFKDFGEKYTKHLNSMLKFLTAHGFDARVVQPEEIRSLIEAIKAKQQEEASTESTAAPV